jgi:hypothetical protein
MSTEDCRLQTDSNDAEVEATDEYGFAIEGAVAADQSEAKSGSNNDGAHGVNGSASPGTDEQGPDGHTENKGPATNSDSPEHEDEAGFATQITVAVAMSAADAREREKAAQVARFPETIGHPEVHDGEQSWLYDEHYVLVTKNSGSFMPVAWAEGTWSVPSSQQTCLNWACKICGECVKPVSGQLYPANVRVANMHFPRQCCSSCGHRRNAPQQQQEFHESPRKGKGSSMC